MLPTGTTTAEIRGRGNKLSKPRQIVVNWFSLAGFTGWYRIKDFSFYLHFAHCCVIIHGATDDDEEEYREALL